MTKRLFALALVALAPACASQAGPTADPPAETPVVNSSAVRLERAERGLDTGADPAAARAQLVAVLDDPTSTLDERDRALLALSRAEEALGNKEGAIAAIEKLLAAHGDDRGGAFPAEEAAEKRLRQLLTGREDAEGRVDVRSSRVAAPIAHVLAGYFGEDERRRTSIRIVSYGRPSEESEKLGTFALAESLRQKARDACPLCEDRPNIHTSFSGHGSWTALPRTAEARANALVILYVDGKDPLPARYESHLPMAAADLAARLAKGEGVIAVKKREGAPPVVLLAAPRPSQLPDVEEQFAMMKALPDAPAAVTLKASLKPNEIQAAVRASFGAFRACYETLQKTSKGVTGKVTMSFAITPEGGVDALSAEPEASMKDAAFLGCMETAMGKVRFPAGGSRTTVKYPIAFSPG